MPAGRLSQLVRRRRVQPRFHLHSIMRCPTPFAIGETDDWAFGETRTYATRSRSSASTAATATSPSLTRQSSHTAPIRCSWT